MKRALAAVWIMGMLSGAGSIHAQPMPLNIEIRGVVGVPMGGWDFPANPRAGLGYGIAGNLGVRPPLSLYLGWDRIDFRNDAAVMAQTVTSGTSGGVRLTLLPAGSPFNANVFGGAHYGSLELGRRLGETVVITRSDSRLGYEAGAGVSFGLAGVILRPNATFRTHRAEIRAIGDFPAATTTASYVVVALGLSPRT
jgi:hypothetical protein